MVSWKLQILTGFSCGRIVWMLNSEPGIASVLDKDASVSGGMERDDPGCRVCQMAVVWAQNQLRQNRTREQIDAYLNQVCTWNLRATSVMFEPLELGMWYISPVMLDMHQTKVFKLYCSVAVIGNEGFVVCCSIWGAQLCERLPSPNGESIVDCDSLSSMPKVSFTIADKIFDLTPEDVCDSFPDFSSSLPFCTTHPIFSNLSCLYS